MRNKSTPDTWRANISYYFAQYCRATTIHGVQYIGERNRSVIERLSWTVVIIVVACTCSFFITQTYHKWVTSPVIVSFASTETSISEIPFPAVTITPLINNNKFNYNEIHVKRKENKSSLTEDEESYFQSFSLICEEFVDILRIGGEDEEGFIADPMSVIYIALTSPYFRTNLTKVFWQDQPDENDDYLQEIFTPGGLSFSFNMLDFTEIFTRYENNSKSNLKSGQKIHKWSLDEGYPKDANRSAFPRRTFMPGLRGGLQIVTFAKNDQVKYSCTNMFTGYQVTLHHPCEFADTNNHFILPLNQVALVAIKPKMLTISEKLKSYNPKDRKCFLNNERQLKYFSYYTQNNCVHECFVNETLESCRCKPFHLAEYEDHVPICGRGSKRCMDKVEETYILNVKEKCGCLPSCTSLEYEIEISQSNFDATAIPGFSTYEGYHSSALVVYYKELQFLATERKELYGYVDFFSNIGGLLGLFVGFSITSVIEIVYFLTLRIACNIKKFGDRNWSGSPELMNATN